MNIKLLIGTGVCLLCSMSFRSYSATEGYLETNNLSRTLSKPDRQAIARKVIITGVVLDEKSQPIPGVGVKTASNKATVTDANGKFSIEAESETELITFSYLGYATQSKAAGNGTAPLTIKMALDEGVNLDDVVVVGVGYGTLKQKEVTSSVAHVGREDFRQSGSRNPLDLIQGKVAGLQISRPGGSNPNSGVSVQLRGAVTATGSGTPLYVIDGIPGGNPDLLQQDDIASVDILKDGSGAAIYGTSANAGVILITTKKGKSGPATFDYSSYFRKEYIQNRPDFLTADEYRQKIASGELKQQDFGHSTDFFDDLINHNNFSQNHNLALTGGSDKTSYRASVNYRNLDGIARENGREEYGLRLNVNQKGLDDKLNVQLNLATNINKANLLGGGGWESESTKNPTLSNFNDDGSYRFDLTSTNEYARLAQQTSYRKQQTSSADAKADLEIVKGLKASIFGSVQRNSYTDGQYRLKASEDSMENTDFPGGGYAYKGDFLEQKYALEPTIQYENTFADKHKITAIGGYSYRYEIQEASSLENRGFINDVFHEDNIGAGAALGVGKAGMSSSKSDNTLIAFFGRVNYVFNDKYMAQFILRHEGSSKFGKNNRWGNFPAVSLGWNMSQENFMKDVKFINYLKLRAGYGMTGNAPTANNVSRVMLGGGGKYLYPDGSYYETYGPTTNYNPDLKWESKRELNIGVDFTMFDNKLTGSLDVFNRKTKDLLDRYTSPQPPYVVREIWTNVGTFSSKGIELALGYKAITTEDFSWNTNLTASTTKNVMDSYSNSQYVVKFIQKGDIQGAGDLGQAFTIFEGKEIGVFYGKRFAGFTDDGKWLFYNRNGEKVRNDQINNSRDDLNATDLAPIGNAVPKYYASWANNFRYKNFDLSIFLRGKFDFDILNTTALSYGNKSAWSGNILKEAFTKYSQINDTYMYSDYYVENGSFVKIDEITLGYNFKLKTKGLRNLRVYVTGQNLATITGYSGNDPDYVLDTGIGNEDNGRFLGIDTRGPYPSTRSFLVGLNVGF
nr:SusC/RagA family TonB-linked outer membrane protein [uncultured Pedobacter sp.]